MKRILLVILTLSSLTISNTALAGLAPVYTSFLSNNAVGGYDTVEYFKQNKAIKGKNEFQTEWKDTIWLFSSKKNLNAFLKSPEKYAPQYGGYCAWAIAHGYDARGDPLVFSIVNDKLYLNYNRDVQKQWEKNIPRFIKNADKNWKKLISN